MGFTLNDVPRDIVVMQKDGDGSWRKLGSVDNLEKTWGHRDGDTFTAEGRVSDDGDEYSIEKKAKETFVLPVAGFEFKPSPVTKCHDAFEKLVFGEFIASLSRDPAYKRHSKHDSMRERLPKRVIVRGSCVICYWPDGSKTVAQCHDGDVFDVETGIVICAIKKWMPGGAYWLSALKDVEKSGVEVEYQEPKAEKKRKAKHEPVDHDHPGRPYMRGGKYGDDEKLVALEMLESGLTLAEVSRRTGISSACLCRWRQDFNDKKGAENGA